MSWNYRMVWGPNRQSLEIREVYYREGQIAGVAMEGAVVETHNCDHDIEPDKPADPAGLAWTLDKMREALAKPAIELCCDVWREVVE